MQSSKSDSSDVIAQVKSNHLITSSTEENKTKFGIHTQVIYFNGIVYKTDNIYKINANIKLR